MGVGVGVRDSSVGMGGEGKVTGGWWLEDSLRFLAKVPSDSLHRFPQTPGEDSLRLLAMIL